MTFTRHNFLTGPGWQIRTRYLWVTWAGGWTCWLIIAGRKPLAHLTKWKRRLFHLQSIRWRLL